MFMNCIDVGLPENNRPENHRIPVDVGPEQTQIPRLAMFGSSPWNSLSEFLVAFHCLLGASQQLRESFAQIF